MVLTQESASYNKAQDLIVTNNSLITVDKAWFETDGAGAISSTG